MIKKLSFLSLVVALAACQTSRSPSTVEGSAYGKLNRAVPARVIGVRPVEVAPKTAEGAAAGAIAGAALGMNGGSKGRDIKHGIVGAVVGAVVGAGIQAAATNVGPASEYVVETDNKTLFTLVQSSTPAFALGDKVLIVQGNPSSLMPYPGR